MTAFQQLKKYDSSRQAKCAWIDSSSCNRSGHTIQGEEREDKGEQQWLQSANFVTFLPRPSSVHRQMTRQRGDKDGEYLTQTEDICSLRR